MTEQRIGEFAFNLLRRLPMALIKEPERMFIGYISVLFGVLFVVPALRPRSIEAYLGNFTAGTWALMFLAGGIAKIWGISITTNFYKSRSIRRREWGRSLERLGASLIGLAFFVYGLVVIAVNGVGALVPGLMVLGLAAANLIRLLASTAGKAIKEDYDHADA